MANTILLKRSGTAGKVPVTANLSLGELSVNYTDGRLYTTTGSAIVDLKQNDPITLSGDATGTSTNPAAGGNYSNLAVTLSTVNSNTGQFGGGAQIPFFTVNGKGLITAAGNVALSTVAVTSATAGTGISVSGATGSVTITNTGVTSAVAGTGVSVSGATGAVTVSIGQSVATTAAPTFAGLTLTGNLASSSTIYGVGVYDSGSRVVYQSTGAGNLTINSGSISLPATGPGATTVGSATSIPVVTTDAYGRVVALTSSSISTSFTLNGTTGTTSVAGGSALTFASTNGVTVAVGATYANISTPQSVQTTATPTFAGMTLNGNLTMQSGGEIVANNLYVTGNLYLAGNTTTVNATSVTTNDLYYVAAANAGTSAAANGAGLITPYAALTYNSTNTAWSSNVALYATALYDNNNRVLTVSSSHSNNGGDVAVTGAYNALVLTLNTVNTNVGTFGNATYNQNITVNGKGLVTGVTTQLITPAWSSITGTPTTLSGYGITDALSTSATIDGGSY